MNLAQRFAVRFVREYTWMLPLGAVTEPVKSMSVPKRKVPVVFE